MIYMTLTVLNSTLLAGLNRLNASSPINASSPLFVELETLIGQSHCAYQLVNLTIISSTTSSSSSSSTTKSRAGRSTTSGPMQLDTELVVLSPNSNAFTLATVQLLVSRAADKFANVAVSSSDPNLVTTSKYKLHTINNKSTCVV